MSKGFNTAFKLLGLGSLGKAITDVGRLASTNSRRNVEAMTRYLWQKTRANADLTDHTLQDLQRMGHPYARSAPVPIHSPSWLVHKQTGRLRDAIKMEPPKRISLGKWQASVYVDTSVAPYAAAVIMGTPTMVPRDFVRGTVEQERGNIWNQFRLRSLSEFGKWGVR